MKKLYRKIHKKARLISRNRKNYDNIKEKRKEAYKNWQNAVKNNISELRWYILYNKYSMQTGYVTKEEKQAAKLIIKSFGKHPPDILKSALLFYCDIKISKDGDLFPDSFDPERYNTDNITNAENIIKNYHCYDAAFYILSEALRDYIEKNKKGYINA